MDIDIQMLVDRIRAELKRTVRRTPKFEAQIERLLAVALAGNTEEMASLTEVCEIGKEAVEAQSMRMHHIVWAAGLAAAGRLHRAEDNIAVVEENPTMQ